MENKTKPIHAKPSLYAFYFEILKEVAMKYGYNLVLHGSMNRDLDLIAIGWEETLGDRDSMIIEFAEILGGNILQQDRSVDNLDGFIFTKKPHNRVVYVININRDFEMKYNGMVSRIKEYSDPQYYIDISVIPNHIDSNIDTFTKDQAINFAKYVWYNKHMQDTEKGLIHYFKEWVKMGCNYK